MTYVINNDYLMHHGIKGQKWGIRRYQNLDGTLTAEGRARFKTDKKDAKAYTKKLNELEKKRVGFEGDRIAREANSIKSAERNGYGTIKDIGINTDAYRKRINDIKAEQAKILKEVESRGMGVNMKEARMTPSIKKGEKVAWAIASAVLPYPFLIGAIATQYGTKQAYRNPNDIVDYKGKEVYQNPYNVVGKKYKVHV